ncbi:putative glycosyl transferase, family 14 [Helianthus anomalus]
MRFQKCKTTMMKLKEFKFLTYEKKLVLSLAMASTISIFLFTISLNLGTEDKLNSFQIGTNKTGSSASVPRFAYLVSGSKGDLNKLWRTVRALYHPWNYYVLHLDLESPLEERMELASRVENDPVFSTVGNVYVIPKANMVTYRGPTMVSNTLHACAILLRKFKDWDWFINLSASDYPLVTQDDLLYVFRDLKRDLNFIEHTSQLGGKA